MAIANHFQAYFYDRCGAAEKQRRQITPFQLIAKSITVIRPSFRVMNLRYDFVTLQSPFICWLSGYCGHVRAGAS